MLQLTRGLKLGTFCKIGEKTFRTAVVHLFTCTQIQAIVQAEIFQVSFPPVLFSLGRNQASTIQGDLQNSPQPSTALCPAAHSKHTSREAASMVLRSRKRAQAHTWLVPLISLHTFPLFSTRLLKKKKSSWKYSFPEGQENSRFLVWLKDVQNRSNFPEAKIFKSCLAYIVYSYFTC